MRKSLLEMYHGLKESGSTSDFPLLLGNIQHKALISRFNGFPSSWKMFTAQSNLSDFKTADRIVLSEAPDLLEVAEGGAYKDSKISEKRYQIGLKTFGRTWTVGRKVIINDDLNAILTIPNMYGRATVRTLVKAILEILKGGVNAYDGASLFALRTSTTRNYNADVSLANTAAGMAAVAACMTQIQSQTDPDTGQLLGISPKYLLTGLTLAPIAQQLVKSAQIEVVSTAGGGKYNPIASLIPIAEPLLDSVLGTSWWAVLADPSECPVIEVGFLDGKQEPDILVKGATMHSVAGGGEDPYGYDFDDLNYKIRHDWAIAAGMYQGISRGHS